MQMRMIREDDVLLKHMKTVWHLHPIACYVYLPALFRGLLVPSKTIKILW